MRISAEAPRSEPVISLLFFPLKPCPIFPYYNKSANNICFCDCFPQDIPSGIKDKVLSLVFDGCDPLYILYLYRDGCSVNSKSSYKYSRLAKCFIKCFI